MKLTPWERSRELVGARARRRPLGEVRVAAEGRQVLGAVRLARDDVPGRRVVQNLRIALGYAVDNLVVADHLRGDGAVLRPVAVRGILRGGVFKHPHEVGGSEDAVVAVELDVLAQLPAYRSAVGLDGPRLGQLRDVFARVGIGADKRLVGGREEPRAAGAFVAPGVA